MLAVKVKLFIGARILAQMHLLNLGEIDSRGIISKIPAILLGCPEFCDVQTGRVRHVNDENVGKNEELEPGRLQLHHVRHLVPPEPDKPVVLM